MIACGNVILFCKITGRLRGSPLRARTYQPDKLKFATSSKKREVLHSPLCVKLLLSTR